MKITFEAFRVSKTLEGHGVPDAGPVSIQGTRRYLFEADLDQPLTFVADCNHPQRMETIADGELVLRPCPLHPVTPAQPSPFPRDNFKTVQLTSCPACPHAGATTPVNAPAVTEAFAAQLKHEDFSGFPELRGEDRDVRRWRVVWSTVRVSS